MIKILILGNGLIAKKLRFHISSNSTFYAVNVPLNLHRFYNSVQESFFIKSLIDNHNDLFIINASGCSSVENAEIWPGLLESEFYQNFEIMKYILNSKKSHKYVFLSSYAVYGECKLPKDEHSELNPSSQYARSKVRIEKMLVENLKESVVIIRPSSVYGQERKNGILAKIASARNMGHVELAGNGDESRDFIHVTRFSKLLLELIERKGFDLQGIWNLGCGMNTNVNSLIELARLCYRNDFHVTFSGRKRNYDPLSLKMCICKLKNTVETDFFSSQMDLQRYFLNELL